MTPTVVDASPFQVEVYRGDPDPAPVAVVDAEALAHEYLELGLVQLAQRARQEARSPLNWKRLDAEELRVWEWRYPTRYTAGSPVWPLRASAQRSAQRLYDWSDLTWPVPAPVRALIQEVRGGFDALEIWTPELRQAPRIGPSPILIGWRGRQAYLLARWAEALEPLEEIRKRMTSRRGRRAFRVRARYVQQGYSGYSGLVGALFVAFASLAPVLIAMLPPAAPWIVSAPLLSFFAASLAFVLHEVYLRLPRTMRWACEYAGWVLEEAD